MSSPPQSERARRAANAAGGTARAGLDASRVAVQPTQAVAAAQAKAIAQGSSAIIEALARYVRKRSQTVIPALQASLIQEFVDRTPDEIGKLIGKEHARERTFLRRQRARMIRDIPGALREADQTKRDKRIDQILARERHYIRLREQALAARAHTAVESLDLQDASPEGAFWMLSESVRQHTPGCVAMANRLWPWKVLREVTMPPVHPGCPCYLLPLDEAVARGLASRDELPDEADAMVRARAAMALEEALYETFGEDAVQEAMLSLEEVRRGETPDRHVPIRRFAKGFAKGGQFMPKLGGSAGAAIHKALPKPRHASTGGGRRLAGRKVWMKGSHVNVPEDRAFSRKIGDSHFTSPPGSTNVYRDGKLVSTPDTPEMHPDVTRPRGATKRGKVGGKGSPAVKDATAEREGKQGRQVERALRTASADVSPVHEGDTAQQAHKALAAGGFKADEANAKETAAALMIPYSHPDGHELQVTIDRETGKVTKATWKPGSEPSDTSKLRKKLGLDKPERAKPPKPKSEADHPSRQERHARQRVAHEADAQRTLGTGDPRWSAQVERAHGDDADAQWDLVTELQARGPESDFAKRLRTEFGAAQVKKWERESEFPNPPTGADAAPPPRYAIRHVSPDEHGPTVGMAMHAGVAGGRGDGQRMLGTGHYFTSRPAKPKLTVRDFDGEEGNSQHITRNEQGVMPVSALAHLGGVRGEVPGEHRNRQGPAWDAFVNDVRQNGVREPILVTVDHGQEPKISEGNHRRDAAIAAGVSHIPVEVRYFGHAQRQGSVFDRSPDKGKGIDLSGAHLMRPRDAEQGRQVAEALGALNGIAESGNDEHRMPDARTGEPRVWSLRDVLDGLPESVDRDHAALVAEHAIQLHRAETSPDGDVAATHMMRALGFDGVDNRHIPELDDEFHGSVVFRPLGSENPNVQTASPGQGGAVVRGRRGRWVWVRGRYVHIPEETEWSHTEDGIMFHSPAGGTTITRRHISDPIGSEVVVSAPRMRPTHPDMRDPRVEANRRNREAARNRNGSTDVVPPPAPPPPPPPPPRETEPDRPPAPEPPAPQPPRPDVHGGQRITGRSYIDGRDVTGIVDRVEQDSRGNWRVGVFDGRRAGEGRFEWLTAEGIRTPTDNPPDGTGLHMTDEERDVLLTAESPPFGGGLLVSNRRTGPLGVHYNANQVEALNANGLPEGQMSVGPLWLRMTPEERQRVLDSAYGRALANSIHNDENARDELSSLWTGGKFTSEGGEHLDRYSANEALAVAHARMQGEDWRDFVAMYPDVARFVAKQAGERGHSVRPDVHEFIHGPETDNVHEPGHPLSNEARAFANTLIGLDRRAAIARLTEAGWVARSRGRDGVASVFMKIDPEDRHVQTIGLRLSDGIGYNALVEHADGTAFGFDPTTVPDVGNTPERLAYEIRSRGLSDASALLKNTGYRELQRSYAHSGAAWVTWARPDSDVVIVLKQDGLRTFDARPAILDENERYARILAFASDDPNLAFPRGTSLADAMEALNRTSWGRTMVPDSGDGFNYIDLHRTFDVDDPENARQVTWRLKVSSSRDAGGNAVATIEEVGKPGVSGRGLAVDDADALAAERAANEALRTSAAEQAERVNALVERIRTSVNAGTSPFTPRDRVPDVVKALKAAGYTANSDRAYQSDGWSTTWVNVRTGARVIVRTKPQGTPKTTVSQRPRYNELDANGNPTHRLLSAQVRRGTITDHGRERTPEGVFPADIGRFTSDLYGAADELAQRYGTETDLSHVRFASPNARGRFEDDHCGYHRSSEGLIVLGKQIRPDLEMLIQARAEGRELTEREKHRVWMAYHTTFHELIHSVGVRNSLGRHGWSTHGYDAADGGQAIEETLTEELARRLAVENLRRHGHDDVARWVRDQDASVRGAYQRHRENFRQAVMSQTGLPENEWAAQIETWKYRMNHAERRADMARKVARAQGITEEQAASRIKAALRASRTSGFDQRPDFRPLLDIDYGDLSTPEAAPLPTLDEAGYAIGTRVRGWAHPEYGSTDPSVEFTGRVTAKTPITARDLVTQVGWRYSVTDPDGNHRLIDHDQITWSDAREDSPPEPPDITPPPPPPAPSVPTVRLSDGGTAAVGSVVYGNHSRQLGQVQSIAGDVLTVRRADGTIANFGGDSFSSRVVTNTGAMLSHGDGVDLDGHTWTINRIDWTNPQEPTIEVSSPGGMTMTLNARQAVPAGSGAGGVSLPLTRRDGSSAVAVTGDRVRLRDGSVGRLESTLMQNWPMGTPMYRVAPADGGLTRTVSRQDIVGFGDELPRPPQWSEGDGDATMADRRALEQAHFDREDASIKATRFGHWLSGHVGEGFGAWASAQGIDLGDRTPSGAVDDIYVNAWRSQNAYDAINEARPRELAAVIQMAHEAGLPTPNWTTRNEPTPDGVVPGDITDERVARSIYTGSFGAAGLQAHISTVAQYGGNGLMVSGTIKTPQGEHVGQFNRRITRNADGSFAVYNALLSIQSAHQGGGFASAFNKHCFDIYRQKGVREVTVSANLDVGGYTWAATGFDFNVNQGLSPLAKAQARAQTAYQLASNSRAKLTAAEWDSIRPKLWAGPQDGPLRQDHVQHAWELAYIDGRPSGRGRGSRKNIGQKLLLRKSWSGVRLMDESQQRPSDRQGEAAQGPVPGGRPDPNAPPPPRARTTTLTARNAQRWLRHNIEAMSPSFRAGVREVATAMETAHPNVRLRNAPSFRVAPIEDGRTAAEFRVVGVGSQITLDPERGLAHRELLTAQQYGTALHDTFLGVGMRNDLIPAYQRFVTAVEGTSAIRRIQNNRYVTDESRERMLSREAVFARAYAQYLAMKSGNDRMRRQLRREQRRATITGGLWQDREFVEVQAALDELFAGMGGES